MEERPTAEQWLSPKLERITSNMLVDAVTKEVVVALSADEIGSVLLKGPTVTSWLYPHDPPSYVDSDLLVRPEARKGAEGTLRNLGFRPEREPGGMPRSEPESQWRRSDDARIDLHWGLTEIDSPPKLVCKILFARTAPFSLQGTMITALDRSARAFHVVVHALKHGPAFARTMSDLDRLIELADRNIWAGAAEIARDLHSERDLAGGLRLHPEGHRIIDELDLDATETRSTTSRAGDLPPRQRKDSVKVARFLDARTIGGRLRLLGRALFPGRQVVQKEYMKDGQSWIAAAYVRRWVDVIRRTIRAGKEPPEGRRSVNKD